MWMSSTDPWACAAPKHSTLRFFFSSCHQKVLAGASMNERRPSALLVLCSSYLRPTDAEAAPSGHTGRAMPWNLFRNV